MQNKKRSVFYMARRHAVLALVMFAAAFFMVPFHALTVFDTVRGAIRAADADSAANPYWTRNITAMVSNIVEAGFNQEILTFGFAGLGFFSAVILFKHLFSRKQALMIASLPLRRQTDFLERVAVYFLTGLLPAALGLLLYPLIALAGGLAPYMTGKIAVQILMLLMIHLYGFTLGAFCASITGQVWACAAGALFLGGGFEFAANCWQRVAWHYLYTMPVEVVMPIIRRWSPAFSLYKALRQPELFSPLAGIVCTAVFVVLAYLAYTRRAAEGAEHPIAIKALEMPLSVIVSLFAGSITGYIFMTFFGKEAALLIAAAGGAVVGWIMVQLAFTLDFRQAFRRLPAGFACGVLLLICVFGFRFDIFGYERYAPDPQKLTAVTVQSGNVMGGNENYTLKQPDTKAAACTLAGMLRDAATGRRVYHDPVYPEMNLTFTSGHGEVRRAYAGGASSAEMHGMTAWQAAVNTLLNSDEYRQGRIQTGCLDEYLAALDTDAAGNIYIYGWEQIYGSGGNGWESYKTASGRQNDAFNYRNTDQIRKVIESLKAAIQRRTLSSLQQDPVFVIHISGRINNVYKDSSFAVYPDDYELLRALGGEELIEMAGLLSGGFAEVTDCAVYRVSFDASVTDLIEGKICSPQKWMRASTKDEAKEWIRASIKTNDADIYYYPAVGNEEIWIFDLNDQSEQIPGNLDPDTDLVQLVMEQQELWYWPAKRFVSKAR
ncbi:MAG: hypothetical protein IJ242_08075 [Clostridia bacterium]|nr:hypothetical protein [Clostridia bacterium]